MSVQIAPPTLSYNPFLGNSDPTFALPLWHYLLEINQVKLAGKLVIIRQWRRHRSGKLSVMWVISLGVEILAACWDIAEQMTWGDAEREIILRTILTFFSWWQELLLHSHYMKDLEHYYYRKLAMSCNGPQTLGVTELIQGPGQTKSCISHFSLFSYFSQRCPNKKDKENSPDMCWYLNVDHRHFDD